MKIAVSLLSMLYSICSFAQLETLKAGNRFPDAIIKNIINAPVSQYAITNTKSNKIIILNFWGTWCSPCIPEMDMLGKLQKKNATGIQVIALSNDSPERLKKYIAKKPTTVWLATDTSYFLYQLFGFASVGHSAIIGTDKKIIALVKTNSINQQLIDRLIKGDAIQSSAAIKETLLNTGADPFGVDSLTQNSFTIRGYMQGKPGMSMAPNQGPYAFRRLSFFNTLPTSIYRRAYGINSPKQMVYEIDEKEASDYENKNLLYCVDILVKPADKDSLHVLLQQRLSASLPIKARIEFKNMPVYVLKIKAGAALNLPVSSTTKSSYSFDGNGYEGTAVLLSDFAADYLTNELGIPVVDETKLTSRYDIKTVNELRLAGNTIKAVERLGLQLEKAERSVKVIVFYK
jgi:uncharacterized protein (TIGR03435 family)